MLFLDNAEPEDVILLMYCQFKQCHIAVAGELETYRFTDCVWKTRVTEEHVLHDLSYPKLVSWRFCLTRKNKVRTAPTDTNIYLINLYLAYGLHRRSQMVLYGVAG